MFGFLAPVLGALGGAKGVASIGLSALSQRRSSRAGGVDLASLRADALANGFNPLTVLQSTGGAGYQNSQEAPGFLSFLAGGMAGKLDTYHQREMETERHSAEMDNLRSNTAYNEALTSSAKAAGSVRTGARETDYMDEYLRNPDGYTMMRTVAGHPVEVRNDVLHRLGLEPGSLYGMAEDAEMIFGEVGGEITGVGNVADASFGGKPLTIAKGTGTLKRSTAEIGPQYGMRGQVKGNTRGQPVRGTHKSKTGMRGQNKKANNYDPSTGWVTGGLPWLN